MVVSIDSSAAEMVLPPTGPVWSCYLKIKPLSSFQNHSFSTPGSGPPPQLTWPSKHYESEPYICIFFSVWPIKTHI